MNSYIAIIATTIPNIQDAISIKDLLGGILAIALLALCISGLVKSLFKD